MSTPMTTKQAEDMFLCDHCKSGCECPFCNCSCVEDRTCSVRCKGCKERVWFAGNLSDQKREFTCPSCGHTQINLHLGGRS